MRHGEREDEVLAHSKLQRLPPARRFDPALTPQGHRQAQQAWKNLIEALASTNPAPKRIAIFSSPLRRVVGTAMMVSDAMPKEDCPWEFLPAGSSTHEKNSSISKPVSIPIVIWNGLCDCAAQIANMGGHRTAFRTGFVPCAATDDRLPQSFFTGRMATAWNEMKEAALHGVPDMQADLPIQFWRADTNRENVVPMTPELAVVDQVGNPTATNHEHPKEGHPIGHHLERESPIDQAIRIAFQWGCDACIIVSHREEIRELYKHRCGVRPSRKNLEYCCIGAFEISTKTQGEEALAPMTWKLHDVVPFTSISPTFVQNMINSRIP